MKKQTKKIIIILITLIILVTILLIIGLHSRQINLINETGRAQYTTTVGGIEYDITNQVGLNGPSISAGMIPVKYDDNIENWIITTFDDTNWYNYSQGKPAYIMLNDGTYQSELVVDMTNKKLASDNVGVGLDQPEDIGSIYMWIPRYAYNEAGEIIYIKQENMVAGSWTMPDIFTYQTETRDFSLAGIWVEYNQLGNSEEVTTKVNNMQGRDNIYGFLANTIGVNAGEQTSYAETIEKYINSLKTTNTQTVGIDTLSNPTNTNRTILKIVNSNKPEPIKAQADYNAETNSVTIQIIDNINEIQAILDEKGNNVLGENKKTITISIEEIESLIFKYTIIDTNNNQKQVQTEVKGDGVNIFVIKDEATLKEYRDAVNNDLTNATTKAYQIADVNLNVGNYTKNTETGEATFSDTAEKWTPIGKTSSSGKVIGTYDGMGHTISGIYSNGGLFGNISSGIIKNLGVLYSSITEANSSAGGIISKLYSGRVENCYSYATLDYSANTGYMGGIVGYIGNSSTQATVVIENCYNKGKISGSANPAGIVGKIQSERV